MHFSLCDFILDILQNSVEAKASEVVLIMKQTDNHMDIVLKDNGRGMSEEEMGKVLDPFYTDGVKHRNRRVGLGLPFLKQTLDETNGVFHMDSVRGEGTKLHICFDMTHVDTPPLGDVPSLLMQSMILDGSYELQVERSLEYHGEEITYNLSRNELQDILGEFSDSQSLLLLRQYLRSQEDDILQGENHG